ncbi:MAG TPA: RluA family pseudouridine synthase [Symbiobacteriaceae bacterium]|nr:RluA family pseudouridine synthase [Symbiobacteriaceae bacterium]
MKEYNWVAETGEARLDAYLAAKQEVGLSRSRIKGLIDEGHVTVNGTKPKASQKVEPGDQIRLVVPEPEPYDLTPEAIPLDIVYEDEDVVVVNKARGMVVHPAAGNWSGTLVHALLDHVEDLEGIGGELRPGIVHRLDKDTTGLLVIAKNERAMAALQDQIRTHTARRIYWALVHGNTLPNTGRVEAPLGRHPSDRKKMAVNKQGKEATTHFTVLERYAGYSLVECRLETGRTHQIRVHMSFIGHPVVGDVVYGTRKAHLDMPGQALHAKKLGFYHPSTEQWMEFETELPADMAAAVERLRRGE